MSEGVATEKTPTKNKAKERWEENADWRLRGRESEMKQKGVSPNFHNVTLMKPFMIRDRDSQRHSLEERLHTHVLMSLNTFPASVEVETFFASAACSESGLPCASRSSTEQYHWGLLWTDWHINSRSFRASDSPALKLLFRRSRVRNTLCPAKAMETSLAWYLVGPGHRLVLIQSQREAWADSTCVLDVKSHGK